MSLVWAAPAQRAFSDWQVTCNNQNFCVARNTGDHNGLVMTLSRSAGAHTDAVLRIERGGLKSPDASEGEIAPRLLLDGEPLALRVEVFNIGTGRGLSVLELINAFEKATGVKLNYQIVGRRAGDIVKVWADPKLANEELGWKAEVGIEDTLRSAWNWQLKLRERGIQ